MLMLRNYRWLDFFDIDQISGITAGVAGRAVSGFLAIVAGFLQAVERKIGQRIRANVFANFLDAVVGGDEFFLARSIDAVEAWGDCWRAGDP